MLCMIRNMFIVISLCFFSVFVFADSQEFLNWNNLADLPAMSSQMENLGVGGPFAGISNNALIIAGGAYFPKPCWENEKVWVDDIWVLENYNSASAQWRTSLKLKKPVAYGVSVTTDEGVVCVGGNDATGVFDTAFILSWDSVNKTIIQKELPSLPSPCAYAAGAYLNGKVYVAGGQSSSDIETVMNNFWVYELKEQNAQWRKLVSWPGPQRSSNMLAVQDNGFEYCIYLFGGRYINHQSGKVECLKDVYEYSPLKDKWEAESEMPYAIAASAAINVGSNHVFVFGGDDGSLIDKVEELKDSHPGFIRTIFSYHTITDTWTEAGQVPFCPVTTTAIKTDNGIIIPSGEIRPRIRTPHVLFGGFTQYHGKFSVVDWLVLIFYFVILILIGVRYCKNENDVNDYFKGGGRIPWWAAGISMFAAQLSAVTFMSIPAKTYATDYLYFSTVFGIFIVAPIVIYLFLPFYYKLNVTTAYEYLEKRFSFPVRGLASILYIMSQIGKIGVVLLLPSLTLSVMTGINTHICIVTIGVIVIIYTAIGGIEAVVWADVFQAIVLLSGAGVCLVIVYLYMNKDFGALIASAAESGKFKMFNFDLDFTTVTIWVILLAYPAGISNFAADQTIVQRYLTTKDQKSAARSIWTGGLLAIPVSMLFYFLGTSLFIYFKSHPENLNPLQPTDSVLPWFVVSRLPVGVVGLVVAGVFAAALSTLDSTVNSVATAFVNDFYKRFKRESTQKHDLFIAKLATMFIGIMGIVIAIIMLNNGFRSLWDQLSIILGLFLGGIAGVFVLGILTKRVGTVSVMTGLGVSLIMICYVKYYTNVHFFLYTLISMLTCIVTGILCSTILPNKKETRGLTIYSLLSKTNK